MRGCLVIFFVFFLSAALGTARDTTDALLGLISISLLGWLLYEGLPSRMTGNYPQRREIVVKPIRYPRIIGGDGIYSDIWIDGKCIRPDFETAVIETSPRHYTWWSMEDAIRAGIDDARGEDPWL